MNRQMKRAQERAEKQQKKSGTDRASTPSATARRAATVEKKRRTPARQFLKEVRQELKKVDWPTRHELITYTTVVLVTVIVLTSYVFGLDWVFSKTVFKVLGG